MSVDIVLSTPVQIDPKDYVAGGRGSLDDLFHPLARYLSIQRVQREVLTGAHQGLEVQALLVEGLRPGPLNLRVKRFFVAITVNRKFIEPSPEEELQMIQALEAFLQL